MKNEAPLEGVKEQRILAHAREDIIKLDTRCLFAGKLNHVEGWEEKPHSHPFCEIMFVLSGEGEISVKGTSQAVQAGDIIVYNPGVEHSERSASNGVEFAFFGITNFKIGELPTDHLIDGAV